jgi:glutamate--cysteine ligase
MRSSSIASRDHGAPSYDEPGGIRDLLNALTRFGWQPVEEGGNVIALTGPDGAISLEPAGQLELSGAPLDNLHETCCEAGRHLAQVKEVGDELGIGFLGLGMWPDKARADLPVMPKGRYKIMMRYMPKVGSLGLDMMLRTCTIQVNLDYASEADMAAKFRVGLALQPLATALFASSPFTEGRPNGFRSFRSHIWSDTDPTAPACCRSCSRTASATSAISTTRSTCRCTSSTATAATSTSPAAPSATSWTGACPSCPARSRASQDFKDHLSTIFPEVRLKNYLEMRGADGGKWGRICALPALWVGLLYDRNALDAAWDAVKHWTLEQRQQLRDAVPREGLTARTPDGESLQASAAASSTSPRPASPRARGSTRPAITRPASSPPCASSLRPARARPTGCCASTAGNGRATSRASTKKRASKGRTGAVRREGSECIT